MVNLRFFQEVEHVLELLFRLAWEASNKCRTDRDVWAHFTPCLDTFNIFFTARRALHALEHIWVRMLQWNVEVRQYMFIIHERDNLIYVRIRIDIVQSHP